MSINPVPAVGQQSQFGQSVQAPRQNNKPAGTPPLPQDKVTISESASQAKADNAKPSSGGDVDHDGDSR